MHLRQGTLARLRPVSAPLLLALFVASAEVAPAVHLATHRNDHTHGPTEDRQSHDAPGASDHDGEPHHLGGAGLFAWLAERFAGHHHDNDATDHDHMAAGGDRDEPAHHGGSDHDRTPAGDHGDGSSAHFLLTLADGPPPPFLPPPPETPAAPPDTAADSCHPSPCPRPPARGPPVLA